MVDPYGTEARRAQAPDNGFCESVLFWQIHRGHYGDINLDERADARQAEVLPLIFQGRAGGFPAQVAALFTEGRRLRGVDQARITFQIAPDRAHRGAEIAGKVKAWAKALTGPASSPGKYRSS